MKTQHPGGTSEDILNHVMKSANGAFGQVNTMEAKIHRLETKLQMMEHIQTQVSTTEEKVKNLMTSCSAEIDARLKEQAGSMKEMINQGVQRSMQQSMDTIGNPATNEVLKISDERITRLMKDTQQEIYRTWETQGSAGGKSSCGCCIFCNESFKHIEEELTEIKNDLAFTNKYSDGLGKMINPIKERLEQLTSAYQKMKEAGSKSEYGSACSDATDEEDRKRQQ